MRRLLSESRLVTLTGVGGVGKTRLALRAAADTSRAFRDGVWFVDLGGVTDPELVVHTVLEQLGVHDDTVRMHRTVLVEHLRDRQMLMVLDNCEHVIGPTADLVDALLRGVPGLRVLVTSRERLGIDGEHLWQVTPLSQGPALALFAERAAAVDPGFVLDGRNHEKVSQICTLLGGIPLAIELAAVRLRVLGLDHLSSRLDNTFRVLADARRGGDPRHQTLHAAVDWSFHLCTRSEQILWARASVFTGTFDLEAAERVCSGDSVAPEEVMHSLMGLVDKSVVVAEQHPSGTRFRLLEPLRQYGLGKLRAAGREQVMRERHRDHYIEWAERREKEWFGPAQPQIFALTRLEQGNLRSALDFCFEHGGDHCVHLASTLWFYWAGCGMLGEGRHWLDRAVASAKPGPLRAKALWVNGYVATLQGDLPASTRMLDECRAYAVESGDGVALAYATHRIACTHLVGDDLDLADSGFHEAMRLYRSQGTVNSHTMLAGIELAIAATFRHDFVSAERLCVEAKAVGEEHGELWAQAYAIWVLALCAWVSGDLVRADLLGRECLRIKSSFHDLLGIVLALEVLAWISASQGDAVRAATLLGATNEIWQSVGYPMFGSRHFGAPHGECESAAVSTLGEQEFRAVFRKGMDLELEEAIAFAIGEEQTVAPVPVLALTPLTRREQQVADLIAGGMSNKEIAARLVIARRTAEGHVERILQKLGFTSRAQIATWVTERRV
ncbi:LuxR C-terminal-related transcriptional regulator [Lentzea sp. BCCO 10_0798]|uniref:LuxR C-terminal-related transcriptional regulator n=1 Tax=Lentzea kristufekii TaxID=3095430 RepID=A0ABU4TQ98_9PSEU|nr:LuxR C-terminal-related transcriptional regulator [Lentzea sp. BCCO 10_0798]MDX8050097.1 LuxR C-terminal-related transcriptional regulator [Lentzea sp. BCCO 10_0798]